MTTPTTNHLAFLDDPTQYDCERLTDLETTVRVLLAMFFQANLSDSYDSDDRQDWQEVKHIEVCSHISKILNIMGMGHVLDNMIQNGEVDFSAPWTTPQDL
tara:strand:- start:241 stop:543 length:303 start_codon:yes stop_codon:yes gene_type:complete